MYLGKKKIEKIKRISLSHEILEQELGNDADFLANAPDTWNDEQKFLYDLLNTLECRILDNVIKIIEDGK